MITAIPPGPGSARHASPAGTSATACAAVAAAAGTSSGLRFWNATASLAAFFLVAMSRR